MKRFIALFAALLLLTTALSCAETTNDLHLYLDIPFSTFPVEELAQLLFEQKQAVLIQNSSTAEAKGLQDFGSTFHFTAYYRSDDRVNRITLRPEDADFADEDQFNTLVEQDIQQFVELDQQLTALYGEPDIRFFWAGKDRYPMTMSEAFMPANNKWSFEELMHVFENDRVFRARSVWNNVILELWPDGIRKHPRGYLTKLTLSYENQIVDGPVKTLFPYPESPDNSQR